MNLRMIVGGAATALVLSAGLAFAQTPGAAAQDGQAAFSNAAAFVGGGSSGNYLMQQRQLENLPGYTTGGAG